MILIINSSDLYSKNQSCKNCNGCSSQVKNSNNEKNLSDKDEFSTDDDSFSKESDEFSKESDEFTNNDEEFSADSTALNPTIGNNDIFTSPVAQQTYILLGFTILAGFFVRFKSTRYLRGLFLVGSIAWLGFYMGGCPCMISSFEELILIPIAKSQITWDRTFWFLGLIPITYIFGRVWCGWFCHLGAFQEFIFRPSKFELLKSYKAQQILKYIRYTSILVLIAQLLITKTNLWCEIDPFKVAFNIYSSNITGYVLLGILFISSVFVNKPFCRGFCPIGTILGLVGKIPGASILQVSSECFGCSVCDKECSPRAITKVDKKLILDNEECILCGDCLSPCKKSGIKFKRSKDGKSKFVFFEKGQKCDC